MEKVAGDIESLLDRKVQALKVGQCVGSTRTLRESGVALTEGSVPTLVVTGRLAPGISAGETGTGLDSRGSCHWVWLHVW